MGDIYTCSLCVCWVSVWIPKMAAKRLKFFGDAARSSGILDPRNLRTFVRVGKLKSYPI